MTAMDGNFFLLEMEGKSG